MKTMTATDFKQKCLREFEQLPREGIIITKRGVEIARVLPIDEGSSFRDLEGSMAGKIEVVGDIFSTGEVWDAES